ncbi:beta-1,4-galactosyltransferase 4 isoform X2 [Alosa pseudoharengus]|uniref:beta-1,4-galactosyltransferase 4 isoform X2 n=1 Tax=Alosa pseudoharengus TaxID=34774 RepID=UPI003F8B2F6F
MMFSAVCKLTRRAKFLFLLLLALVLLVWITSFAVNDTIRAIQESPRLIWGSAVDLRNVNSLLGGAKHDRPSQLPAAATEKPTRPPLQICSEHPPLLRGAIALSFPPSLSLSDVEEENREQLSPGGQSQPSNCISRQKVAVLIPHRNREKHLLYLLHYLHPFLQRQQLHYGIYVIHQAGNVAFNRAKLLNVGYLEALKDQPWDCFIFHDVDLVPENDHNLYTCDTQQPKHLVVGRNVTGYKVELQKMKIVRPSPEVGRYTMVFHKRDVGNEINKDRMSLLQRTPQMWRSNGLNSCSYRTVSIQRVPLYVNITVEIGHP